MAGPLVLASLRSADLDRLDEELKALEAGGIDGFHVDVMDGQMVEERCFSPDFVRELGSKTSLLVDVHLIAEQPEALFEEYAAAGAHRIAFHAEAVDDPARAVTTLRDLGVKPGVVLFPGTELAALDPVLETIALVNPLGVDPRQGLGFQESTYERIAELKAARAAMLRPALRAAWRKNAPAKVRARYEAE